MTTKFMMTTPHDEAGDVYGLGDVEVANSMRSASTGRIAMMAVRADTSKSAVVTTTEFPVQVEM